MNLREELFQLVRALDAAHLPYALCGGLALAVHGWPRATLDIDLLIEPGQLEPVRSLARTLGYTHDAGEMPLAGDRVRIWRLVKLKDADHLPLDLLLVSSDLLAAWQSRTTVQTEAGPLTVVSADGLIHMKSLRNSGTDQDDMRRLKGGTDATR